MSIHDIYQDMLIDKTILNNTLVGVESLKNIIQLSTAVQDLNDCIAEVGVYKGGTSLLLCKLNPENEVFVFDTFNG
jgi:hypothetical protein